MSNLYLCHKCQGYSDLDEVEPAWNECPACGSIMTQAMPQGAPEWVQERLLTRWGLVVGETLQDEADLFREVED